MSLDKEDRITLQRIALSLEAIAGLLEQIASAPKPGRKGRRRAAAERAPSAGPPT